MLLAPDIKKKTPRKPPLSITGVFATPLFTPSKRTAGFRFARSLRSLARTVGLALLSGSFGMVVRPLFVPGAPCPAFFAARCSLVTLALGRCGAVSPCSSFPRVALRPGPFGGLSVALRSLRSRGSLGSPCRPASVPSPSLPSGCVRCARVAPSGRFVGGPSGAFVAGVARAGRRSARRSSRPRALRSARAALRRAPSFSLLRARCAAGPRAPLRFASSSGRWFRSVASFVAARVASLVAFSPCLWAPALLSRVRPLRFRAALGAPAHGPLADGMVFRTVSANRRCHVCLCWWAPPKSLFSFPFLPLQSSPKGDTAQSHIPGAQTAAKESHNELNITKVLFSPLPGPLLAFTENRTLHYVKFSRAACTSLTPNPPTR